MLFSNTALRIFFELDMKLGINNVSKVSQPDFLKKKSKIRDLRDLRDFLRDFLAFSRKLL